jgi:hypothetical protein
LLVIFIGVVGVIKMADLKLLIPKLENENPGIKAGVINKAGYKRTVREMIRIASTHKNDLIEYADWSILKFYLYVRALEYRRDIPGVETLVRPKYSIKKNWKRWRDCDDKTMLIISWAMLNNKPWRIAVVGKGDHPHHVYPELNINHKWLPVDPTFGPDQGHKNVSYFGKKLYQENFREIFV